MAILKSDSEIGVNTLEPRNTGDIQICIHDYLHGRIDEATLRDRLVFFTLNASSVSLKAFAERLQ
jgi:hypothetical protein